MIFRSCREILDVYTVEGGGKFVPPTITTNSPRPHHPPYVKFRDFAEGMSLPRLDFQPFSESGLLSSSGRIKRLVIEPSLYQFPMFSNVLFSLVLSYFR